MRKEQSLDPKAPTSNGTLRSGKALVLAGALSLGLGVSTVRPAYAWTSSGYCITLDGGTKSCEWDPPFVCSGNEEGTTCIWD